LYSPSITFLATSLLDCIVSRISLMIFTITTTENQLSNKYWYRLA
jgi:hypothetical protein